MSKKHLIPLLALLPAMAIAEQDMYVWKTDGTKVVYSVNDVDSITFKEKITPEPSTSMPSDAKTLASKMFTGINIGNTLESTDNRSGWCPDGETCWGADKVTKELIDAYKKAGFNTIRIPVAWHGQESDTINFKIKDSWMARVKQIVDWCIEDDLYVIVNIHWDSGWLENNCTTAKQAEVNKEQAALWQQIATTFKDYDEHLLFASANEPEANDAEAAAVLKSYHQTFVNTVRASGGNNGLRNLIIQSPGTAIDKALEYDVVPTDVVENRMMYEVHFYPYTYALMEEDAPEWNGVMHYFWGAQYDNIVIDGVNRSVGANGWCNEAYVDAEMEKMKKAYVDQRNMPVILGEYAVMDRELNDDNLMQVFHDSRSYYYQYVARAAKNNGIVPILWDTPGNMFNRTNGGDNSVLLPKELEGIMKGSKEGEYPF